MFAHQEEGRTMTRLEQVWTAMTLASVVFTLTAMVAVVTFGWGLLR